MKIREISVTGGFLDGLSLSFDDALNTIIGPRGSGKTSIIELIRYCLDVSPLVSRKSGVAVRQALAVLGDGKVTVTIEHSGEVFKISRTAGFDPSASGVFPEPVVLASSEIEQIGVEPSSRLGLLDTFVTTQSSASVEQKTVSELSTVSNQIQALFADIEDLRGNVDSYAEVDQQLADARRELATLQNVGPALEAERTRLNELGAINNRLQAERSEAERLDVTISRQMEMLRAISLSTDQFALSDRIAPALMEFTAGRSSVIDAITHLEGGRTAIHQALREINNEALELAEATRPLRAKLNDYVAGLGTITTRIQSLEQQVAQRKTAEDRILTLEKDAAHLRNSRESLLAKLESMRHARFTEREIAAAALTKSLGPRIRVTVARSGSFEVYQAELADLLRGSGLHKSLFSELARKLSPRDLITFVENGDVGGLKAAAGINAERARKTIDYLKMRDCTSLLVLNVEDYVRFWLLDGTTYKSSDEVSMGQRCTIVLPILMKQLDVPLILDQPEDNLDNAFIVQTLIWAIQQRKKVDQLIIATHNPNLPVLGGAEKVIYLGSDGKSGFARHVGPLDDAEIVEAITTVMEGGKQAFELRAAFYRQHAIPTDA